MSRMAWSSKFTGIRTIPRAAALCALRATQSWTFCRPRIGRLTHPLTRIRTRGDGKWETISWDEALDTIAAKLQAIKNEYGAEAVWFHKGSRHDNAAGDVRGYLHQLANLFGTPNLSGPLYICNGPRAFNMFKVTGAVPSPDVEHTICVVLWGINPSDTALPQRLKIQDALKGGAKLIVVDPRKTFFASRADVHLQRRPGTDGALALGLLKMIVKEDLFDRQSVNRWTVGFSELESLLDQYSLDELEAITWVPQHAIRQAARLYTGTPPASIFLGQALDQHTGSSQAFRAIASLISVRVPRRAERQRDVVAYPPAEDSGGTPPPTASRAGQQAAGQPVLAD